MQRDKPLMVLDWISFLDCSDCTIGLDVLLEFSLFLAAVEIIIFLAFFKYFFD